MLVTGAPRSGTTWLARQLASSPGAALPGREPMNPQPGQYALGGTVHGWTPLADPTPRQLRLLRRTYAGREPRTSGRYGVRQWAAPLPWTTTVVKDPFALLAVPAVVAATGAVPVVVYRHPGAVLASYRRMGWTADAAQVRAVQGLPPEGPVDDLAAMTALWGHLHREVLRWADDVPGLVVVAHRDLSLGGGPALDALRTACGLRAGSRTPRRAPADGRLHRFDRAPAEVAGGWRTALRPGELEALEAALGATLQALDARRMRVPVTDQPDVQPLAGETP